MKEFFLAQLRDRSSDILKFRAATAGLSRLMATEIAAPFHPEWQKIILVPILRAGVAILPAFLELFKSAPIGFLGIQREEETAIPHLYYEKLPPLSPEDRILLLDPMLATGGSANLALDILKAKGAMQITLAVVIATRIGIDSVKKRHPDTHIYVVATDDKLDAKKFIVPGLGDFGNRYFGTD